MLKLENNDYKLIEIAKATIKRNYDNKNFNHTVGSAVLTSSGKIYSGVNLYSLHGACAEQVAIGSAITAGERDIKTIVAVRGEEGEEIIAPCGNCRQILADYFPDCDIIIASNSEIFKVKAKELLPYAYHFENN